MPGRNDQTDGLCRRCQGTDPVINVRTEPLCLHCFNKYVQTKVVKRMETFRTRYAEADKDRYLLLPTSFGPCSVALVHLLSQHLKRQAGNTGRTGFKLHVLHIKHDLDDEEIKRRFEALEERYPDHVYSTINVSEALETTPILQKTLASSEAKSVDGTNGTNRSNLRGNLNDLLASLPSPTSRADLLPILLRRCASTFALQTSCEAILWSDSTTRLAERTIAETAKGRGFALPHLTADGPSPFGLPFYYPLRDLLSKEISSYLAFLQPSVDGFMIPREVGKAAVSAKNATIDGLMGQYFESVERDYPSIVANVVRTTGKLRAKAASEVEESCELCEMPLTAQQAPERSRLCYGCIRTLPQAA